MKTIQLSICDSFPKNCIINNSFRALYIILTLLLLCLHNEVKPQNNTIGAGSYEVYTGSAFHIRQLMDSSQWSYVRRIGDGIFWHPVGYHNTDGYDNITPEEWKVLAKYFIGKKCLVEGDMNADRIADDIPAIRRVIGLGFNPTYAFVNRIPNTTVNWIPRVDTNLTRNVKSCTMLAPHVMEKYPNGFYDIQNAPKLTFINQSYGTSVDAPTYLFVNRPEAYRKTVYDAVDYCHKNGKKFLFLISPNASGDNFLRDAITTVHYLEDNDRIPDFYGVEIYGLSWGINLTPESQINASGDIVCANTVTGVSRWLLKHARADEHELDLWVKSPDGVSHNKNIVCESFNEASPIIANAWTGSNGTFTYTLYLKNRSKHIDFIPTIKAIISGLPAGWTIKYTYAGIDITNNIISNDGYLFYKNNRVMPLDEKAITITISKTGETQLPATLDMSFEVRPQPKSIFVRDVITIKTYRTDMWDFASTVENWNTPTRLSMTVANSINTISISGADSYVYSPNFLNISADAYKYVIISMQNQTGATSAELFWTTNAAPTINSTKRVGFTIVANDTKQRYYIIDLSTNPNWTGTIKQLRLDPSTASSGTVKIDFIKFTGAYPTTIANIPGIIEAENFNFGNQGNSYYDATPTSNSGGLYRTNQGVDIGSVNDNSSNYAIGWVSTGEWLEYIVSIQESVDYDIKFRISAPNNTGKIQLYLDGELLQGLISIPSTTDYSIFQDFVVTRSLPAGIHVLRIHVSTAGFNINNISFTKTNHAPTNVTLSSTSVNENLAVGSNIGTLSSTDPDAGNTFTYSLAAGGTDNASFTITGNTLKTNAVFNYEDKSSYSIKLRTTDQGGLYYEKTITITIQNINETPSNVTLSATTINENLALGTTVGTFTTTDPDAGNTITYSLATGGTDNASFTITDNTLNTNDIFNYEAKSSYSIKVRTTDQGGLYYEKNFTISITDIYDNLYWDFTDSLDGWKNPHNLSMIHSNGSNSMTITGTDPNVYSPDYLNANAELFNIVVIRMQNKTTASTAELFWATYDAPGFSSTRRVSIPIVANDTIQRYYIVDVSNNTNWSGAIKQLRLDPTIASTGSVDVDFIKITGPYPTSISSIPGIIEAENYNYGGIYNAYYETTPLSNSGNKYRTNESVDITQHPTVADNYVVGWIAAGEWMEYIVNVESNTFYKIQAVVSSPSTTGKIQIEFNGNIIASKNIINTTAFSLYDTLSFITTEKIPQGKYVLRITALNSGFNIDKLIFSDAVITQNITLNKGWNLISTYVQPEDNTIETLFSGLDVAMIKDANSFWKAFQPSAFNSLKTMSAGNGYLVYMNAEATLSISGTPLEMPFLGVSINGWSLIGCPYQTSSEISSHFNATNCQTVKNFDGYWIPNATLNSIQSIEPGKAYFIKSK